MSGLAQRRGAVMSIYDSIPSTGGHFPRDTTIIEELPNYIP